MNQNNNIKQFSYVGIGRLTAIGIQAVFYFIFARLLIPESYGELSVIIALAGTFSIFSRFGLNITLQVQQAKRNVEVSDKIKTLVLFSTIAASLILLPINIFASLLCLGLSLFTMSQQDLLGLKNYKKFMHFSILRAGLFILFPILFYFVLEIPGIIIGMAISNLVASIPFFYKFKIKSFFELKDHIKVIIHNYVMDSSGSLEFTLDKLIIASFMGLYLVGVYQLNVQVLLALGVIPTILSSYLISEESSGFTHKKISYLALLSSVIVAILAIFSVPYLVNEFLPKYSEGISSMQIMILTIIPQTIGSYFGAKLISRESTKMGYIALIKLIAFLILIVFLGDLYGLIGLSLALLLSTLVGLFVLLLYFKKQQSK